MTTLHEVSMVIHIIGLTTVAGATLSGFITRRQFWGQYAQDKQKGFAVMKAVSGLPVLAGIGLLLLVISGMSMVAVSHGIYGQQLWFKIKMIVVLLVIATNILMTRGLVRSLHKLVVQDMDQGNETSKVGVAVRRIGYVQLSLLTFFVLIFILSVFRFN